MVADVALKQENKSKKRNSEIHQKLNSLTMSWRWGETTN